MKPDIRQRRIRDLVSRDGESRVDDLAAAFGVSLGTIRRDLVRLAQAGTIQRAHGRVRRLRLFAEGSRAQRAAEGSKAMGQIPRCLVEPGEILFIDAGTTTLACAEALSARDGLTVITDSIDIAQRTGRNATASVFLRGGECRAGNSETVGPLVVEQVGRFQADRAILTVAGLDAEAGVTDSNFDEAQVARTMIERAGSTVVVAHADKLGRRAAFRICAANEIDLLVCDAPLPEDMAPPYGPRRVEVAWPTEGSGDECRS